MAGGRGSLLEALASLLPTGSTDRASRPQPRERTPGFAFQHEHRLALEETSGAKDHVRPPALPGSAGSRTTAQGHGHRLLFAH